MRRTERGWTAAERGPCTCCEPVSAYLLVALEDHVHFLAVQALLSEDVGVHTAGRAHVGHHTLHEQKLQRLRQLRGHLNTQPSPRLSVHAGLRGAALLRERSNPQRVYSVTHGVRSYSGQPWKRPRGGRLGHLPLAVLSHRYAYQRFHELVAHQRVLVVHGLSRGPLGNKVRLDRREGVGSTQHWSIADALSTTLPQAHIQPKRHEAICLHPRLP